MFVLTAFLIKGPKIIIKVALFIVEHFKSKVMKAKAFDEIYTIFSKEPFEEITTSILAKMFAENKKFKITNSILLQKQEELRPIIVAGLQESFSYEAQMRNNNQDRRLKFLNQFYLFNGFNKFIEYQIKQNKDSNMTPAAKEKLLQTLKLINSNLDKKERDVMRIFDCDPSWPICLYDFTFKNRNNKHIVMRARKNLKDYVVEDYIKPRGGINKTLFTYEE